MLYFLCFVLAAQSAGGTLASSLSPAQPRVTVVPAGFKLSTAFAPLLVTVYSNETGSILLVSVDGLAEEHYNYPFYISACKDSTISARAIRGTLSSATHVTTVNSTTSLHSTSPSGGRVTCLLALRSASVVGTTKPIPTLEFASYSCRGPDALAHFIVRYSAISRNSLSTSSAILRIADGEFVGDDDGTGDSLSFVVVTGYDLLVGLRVPARGAATYQLWSLSPKSDRHWLPVGVHVSPISVRWDGVGCVAGPHNDSDGRPTIEAVMDVAALDVGKRILAAVTPTSTIAASYSTTTTPAPSISVTMTSPPTTSATETANPTPSTTKSLGAIVADPSPSAQRTPASTPSAISTPVITMSLTKTPRPSVSAAWTSSPTRSAVPSRSKAGTPVPSATKTETRGPTGTPTQTQNTRQATPISFTATRTNMQTPTATRTGPITTSPTGSSQPTRTATRTPTYTTSNSRTPSYTPSITATITTSLTLGASPSTTATVTSTGTSSMSQTQSPSASMTATYTTTQTGTASGSQTTTPSSSSTSKSTCVHNW